MAGDSFSEKWAAFEKNLDTIRYKCKELQRPYNDLKQVEANKDVCVRFNMEAARPRPIIVSPLSEYNDYDIESVTLVVSVTPDRFKTIEKTMEHWAGPVSVALYLDCGAKFAEIFSTLKTWIQKYIIDIHLVLGKGVSIGYMSS